MDQRDVIRYYEDCHIDYRLIWGVGRNYGLHYGFYDDEHRHHHEAVLNQNRVVAERAQIKPGERVLDCGCGIGGSCIWLAQNLGAHCVGVNITAYQLERARQLVREKNLQDRIDFIERDFADTGLPDASFDVVWGMEAMSYAADKRKLVQEIYRVLKPGGRLVVSDGWRNDIDPKPGYEQPMRAWLDSWAVPHLAGVREFEGYLGEVGFQRHQFWDAYDYVMRSSRRMYLFSLPAYPGGKLLQWLGIRNEVQWGNIRAAYLQYGLLKARAWIHGHFVAWK